MAARPIEHSAPVTQKKQALRRSPGWKRVLHNYELYLFILPTLAYFILFHYVPMYGVQIAFKNFIAVKGVAGSPWVGFEHFERFFESYQFITVMRNTLGISLYELLVAFPAPILLALLLNQVTSERFKKIVQTVTYAPHFISVVVIAGMLYLFLSPKHGLVNQILVLLGVDPVFFMASPEWFKTIYVFSGIWQNIGWAAIIYLAALSGVNPDLHEAAVVDGATKLQRIRHIDLPTIMPTIVILLILNVGHLMSIGFEKVYLLQNQLNIDASEIIQTYVYKAGLMNAQFSYSAAIGLFNSIVNFILLISVNQLAKKTKQASLW
ncbi:ABC transporter permease [Paenibacillus allorhizosphaerae]|uniref:Multiple-sugar transport system permease YteP n=1 Tax=Paenibacillus allorhizosphaerae TaxID=2849866 RepID=A0ABN7TKK0_9BACL|nr:putative multiple-sugar transport system permease YteP [Paenibacillus allorhizosphaerae]